jgi:hypothetical protein
MSAYYPVSKRTYQVGGGQTADQNVSALSADGWYDFTVT